MVEPGHPFQRRQFHRFLGLPRCPAVDQLGLVQPVDRLGQRVVVAVALAAHRRLDAGLGQTLAVADRDVLRAAVAVMDQGVVALGLPGVQRLLQRVEHEVGVHRTAHPPADDAPGEHVDDEGHVQPALPGRDVGEVRHPELIRPLGLELPIDPVQRARRRWIADRRAHDLAADHTAQAEPAHQALDRAAGHRYALAVQLAPDLVGAVDLQVGLPDPFDLRHQDLVASGPRAAQLRPALSGRMAPIARRGDLQHLADRLDPVHVAMLVDEVPQDLSRRSSSAWAKNALASFRISLALRSSCTSRSSSLIRCCSAVVGPSR